MATVNDPLASPRRRTRSARGDGILLRDEILEVTTRLLTAAGDQQKVSMAKIAAAVGCSEPAIYMHFSSKRQLVLAVYEQNFKEFRSTLLAAQTAAADPLASLVARGHAYVAWGLANEDAYRMLFMLGEKPDQTSEDHDQIGHHTLASFEDQVDAVQACVDMGIFPSGDARAIASALWMTAHGLVSLQLAKPDFDWPDPDVLFQLAFIDHGSGIDSRLRTNSPDRETSDGL